MSVAFRRLRAAAVSLAILPLGGLQAGAQDLPAAKDLIQRYVKAINGDAWKSHKSAKMTATLEVPSVGMSATIQAMNIFPTTYVMKMDIPGMGAIESGYDGTTAWMKEPMTGARLLEGAEAEQVADEAEPESALRTSSKIVSSETVEKTTMNGQDCYKVKHTWKSGRTTVDCFAVDNGLLIATTITQVSQMGEVEVTTFHSDYKDFGGIKRPTVTKAQMMGQEAVTTITSWEWDTVTPTDVEPPADIKALMKKG